MAEGLRDLAKRGGSLLDFDPRLIEVEEGHNPRRFDTPRMRERLDELKTSILAIGVQHPISVRADAGRAILVTGESRLRACIELMDEKKLPAEYKIPVQSVKAMNEERRILLALVENTGEPLTQVEQGTAFQRLVAHKWSIPRIAAEVGRSVRFVTDALAIFDAPVAVQEMVVKNEVTLSRAVSEVKKKGSKAAETLAVEVKTKKEAGKAGPVKREKVAPVVPISEWEAVGRAILAEVEPDLESMTERDDDTPWISVSAKLIMRLRELR